MKKFYLNDHTMKKVILSTFILSLLMFSACKKPDNTSGVYLDVYLDLSFVDQYGNDLLRPSTPNGYDASLFRLEYYHQGKLVTYYKSNYTAKYGVMPNVFSSPSTGLHVVRIFPPADTTFLKLSNGDVDTLWTTTRMEGNRSYESITKVWYNGKPVWDMADKTDRYIVVKKHID